MLCGIALGRWRKITRVTKERRCKKSPACLRPSAGPVQARQTRESAAYLSFRGFDESLEQRPELAGPPEVLRMPLDAEAERADGSSIASMTPSGAVADTLKPGRQRLDCLMMAAVDLAGVRVAQALVHQLGEQRILLRARFRARNRTTDGRHRAARGPARRSPATEYPARAIPPSATFSTCRPRQMAKIGSSRRRASRPARSRTRPARARPADRRMRRLRRIASARHRRRRSAAGRRRRRAPRRRLIDASTHADLAAGVKDGLLVVLELAARGDCDLRPWRYIRVGTSMPIRSSARVSCARKYATPAARQRLRPTSSSLRIGYRW